MKNIIAQITDKYKCDNFLFTNPKELAYLTGADFDGFWLLAAGGKIYALCPQMISNQVREFFKDTDTYIYVGTPLGKKAAEIIKENGQKSLFADSGYMTASDYLYLNGLFAAENIKLKAEPGILDDLRKVKSAREILCIKEACRIVSEVCEMVKAAIKPGMSELDIHYAIIELFAKTK